MGDISATVGHELTDAAKKILDYLANVLNSIINKPWSAHGEKTTAEWMAAGRPTFFTFLSKDQEKEYTELTSAFEAGKIPYISLDSEDGQRVLLYREKDLDRVKEIINDVNLSLGYKSKDMSNIAI